MSPRTSLSSVVLFVFLMAASAVAQFNPGPYGTSPFQIAAPFTLITLDGDWDFQATWNGEDCYIFVMYQRGNTYSESLWHSSKQSLFLNSPRNVHYFFLSYEQNAAKAQQDVTEMKTQIEGTLAAVQFSQDDRDYWNAHCHFVPATGWNITGWVGDVLRNNRFHTFAIDRFQRLRPTGLLSYVDNPTPPPELFFLTAEAKYFHYERDLDQKLKTDGATVVPVFVNAAKDGDRFSGAIQFPDAETMKQYDRMEFELSFGCTNHAVENCFEWDYLANFFLCDDTDSTKCTTEIGRWITAYRREGHWVTDATPLLPFFLSGGAKRFRFNTINAWILNLNVRLFKSGSNLQAFEILPLWTGGQFNLQYNPGKLPVAFTAGAEVKKAQVIALISGHGFGADAENCCEFCNHTHHFGVNGTEYVKSHPEAGTQLGCYEQVPDGVTPNQYGTWYFGRGGWCPGFVVKPFIADVTGSLVPGENTLTYKALFKGKDYNPVPSGGGTFWGRIDMTSYLVLWRETPPLGAGDPAGLPSASTLGQNYPNPFRFVTRFEYTVPRSAVLSIAVYDLMGRRVATVMNGSATPGRHSVQFLRGGLSAGMYICRLTEGTTVATRKMLVMD